MTILKSRFSWAAAGLALAAMGAAVVVLPPLFSLGLLAAGLFVSLLAWRPAGLLVILLLLRSSADSAQDLFVFFPGSWYSFNAAGLLNILAFGIALFMVARRFARGERWLPSAPIFLLGLLLIASALSLPASHDLGTSVKAWTRLAGYLGIALLAFEIAQDEKTIRKSLQTMLLAALPPLLLGYYQVLTGSGYYFIGYLDTPFAFRPQGTFGHPAILASFLVTLICLLLSAEIYHYSLGPRWLMLGFTAASFVLLVLTYARTEWIGLIASLSIIGLLRLRRLFFIGIVIAGLLFSLPIIQERLQGEQASESFEWRLDIWKASLKVLQNPTLLGTGLDTSPAIINKVLVNAENPPHNDYLRNAIEIGLIGLAVFLLLQLSQWLLGWHAFRYLPAIWQNALGLALLAITAGGVVISLSDNYLSYVSVQWYNWAIVGLLAAGVSRKPDRERA